MNCVGWYVVQIGLTDRALAIKPKVFGFEFIPGHIFTQLKKITTRIVYLQIGLIMLKGLKDYLAYDFFSKFVRHNN